MIKIAGAIFGALLALNTTVAARTGSDAGRKQEMTIACVPPERFETEIVPSLMLLGTAERSTDERYHMALFYDPAKRAVLTVYSDMREYCLISVGYNFQFDPDALRALHAQLIRTPYRRR